jgi:endonuclease YncB( thermonuclease family)
MRYIIIILILLGFLDDAMANPYNYKVLRVVDGDTVEIEAGFLPVELGSTLKLRLIGIDTPEKGKLAKCAKEAGLSLDAKIYVEVLISQAKDIKVVLKKWDKYGGRVLGDLILDGSSLTDRLLSEQYGVAYSGKKKVMDWCK